jgi:hypothetical protein
VTSEYGNMPWDIYVYGSYIFVACFILLYAFKGLIDIKRTLNSIEEEGFLSYDQNKSQPIEKN